jgi:hypothetical protein
VSLADDAAVLRDFAENAEAWLRPKIPDGLVMPYSLIRLRTALLRGEQALEVLDTTGRQIAKATDDTTTGASFALDLEELDR